MWVKYLDLAFSSNFVIFRSKNCILISTKEKKNILVLTFFIKFSIFSKTIYIWIKDSNLCIQKFKLFHNKVIKLLYNFLFFINEKISISGIGLRCKKINSFVQLRLGYSHHCCVFFDFPLEALFEKNSFLLLSFFEDDINSIKKKIEYLKFLNPYKILGVQIVSKYYKRKVVKKE